MIGLMLLLAASPPANANTFVNGNALYAMCMAPGTGCAMYVAGVVDAEQALEAAGSRNLICEPDGTDTDQAKAVVVKFLKTNSADRHSAAASLVIVAMAKAFPCPQ